MDLNIKGINDIYSERYITTIKLINSFRSMNFDKTDSDTENIKVNNIVVDILNNYLKK